MLYTFYVTLLSKAHPSASQDLDCVLYALDCLRWE